MARNQLLSEFGHPPVAKSDDFREIVPGIDVKQRKRERTGAECLFCDAQQANRILTP